MLRIPCRGSWISGRLKICGQLTETSTPAPSRRKRSRNPGALTSPTSSHRTRRLAHVAAIETRLSLAASTRALSWAAAPTPNVLA